MPGLSIFHVMAKPPADLRRVIYGLPGVDDQRGAELLHWTVLPLGTLASLGCDLKALIAMFEQVEADPISAVFDRVEAWQRSDDGAGSVALQCRSARGLGRFRKAVREAFLRAGATLAIKPGKPHVTLRYGWKREGYVEPIAPLDWYVNELLLIESVHGETRHELHGRRLLAARQATFFPLWGAGAAAIPAVPSPATGQSPGSRAPRGSPARARRRAPPVAA